MFGARRNKSFIVDDDGGSSWPPKKSNNSFHASTDLQRDRDGDGGEETVEDMRDTIAELRRSVMTHATSSAETMEHFSSLQRAHDTLYKEHVHLQEQMDDAVELLKYLKEEKGMYEEKISELKTMLAGMRGDGGGSVVSVTIATLTKEKMEVEAMVKQERTKAKEAMKRAAELDGTNKELTTKVESLAKVKEAYDLQTKQQLENNMKLMELQKERGEMLDKIRSLEQGGQNAGDNDEIMEAMAKEMEKDKETVGQLKGENEHLSSERQTMQEQLDALQKDLGKYRDQEAEIAILNGKLSSSLSQIAQLQQDQRKSRESSAGASGDTQEKLDKLEEAHRDLQKEKTKMQDSVWDMEKALRQKDEQLEATKGEYEYEKRTFQRRLEALQEQMEGGFQTERESMARELNKAMEEMEGYQCQVEVLQRQQQEAQKQQQEQNEEGGVSRQSSENGHNELLLENESLKYKLQELEEKMEVMKDATAQRGEAHAQLEKEMQERLAKRIAVQLHEQKIAMEAQVREELEAEYRDRPAAGASSAEAQELEAQLREQLMQMKDERERWTAEQEDINKKVMESQEQFAIVREGFKKKLNKEKAYSRELQADIEAKEEVISKLSDECQEVVQELEDLRESQSDQMSRKQWEEEREGLLRERQDQMEEMARREERHAAQIQELQGEIDELLEEQTSHENEYKRWEEEREALERRADEKDEELRRAMDDLEQLNGENAEYLRRIEECEEKVGLMKEEADEHEGVKVKLSVLQIEEKELKIQLEKSGEQNESLMKQLEQLNLENSELGELVKELEKNAVDLTTNLDSMTEERNKLQESLKETSQVCLEMESKQSAYKRDKEKDLEECQRRIQELESKLGEMEAASTSAALAVTEKEKAISDLAQMESKHQQVVAGLQAHVSDTTSQVTKLIDQLSAESSEKATLATKLVSVTYDLSAMKEEVETQTSKIKELESSIESLTAERDALNARVTELVSRAETQNAAPNSDESSATIARLEAEKAEAIAKSRDLEDTITGLQSEAESLTDELNASKSEVIRLETQIEQLEKSDSGNKALPDEDESKKGDEDIEDLRAEINALHSEIDELKETNAQLMADSDQNMPGTAPSTEASVDDLMKNLVEVNNEVQQLKDELRDTKDNNVALQEAVQDIQVEKEDLELENEELASKLTDLTTQAKKMLLNNESLEEDLQDQQIEYEDRIAELEGELAEKDEDDGSASLRQKHKAALDTIEKLRNEIDESAKDETKANDGVVDKLERVEEENLELRQVVEHLSSENEAAKEIKSIVLELRAKNSEISESLRVAQEQNQLAVDVIENLKVEKERLQNDVVALQSDAARGGKRFPDPVEQRSEASKMSGMEAELRQYKTMVSQMSSERSVFNQRLSQLMDISDPSQQRPQDIGPSPNAGALVPIESKALAEFDMTETGSYAPPPDQLSHSGDQVEEQIRTLTIENGQLAQRLGGAVAEKEFAMTTLSKLGAKMEELIERNKLLSDIADVKSHHASSRASYYSGGQSRASYYSEDRSVSVMSHNQPRHRPKPRGLDPDASTAGENDSAYSSYYDERKRSNFRAPSRQDDPSAYSEMASTIGSSIISFQQPARKLEPESASVMAGIREEDSVQSSHMSGMHRQASDPSEAHEESVISSPKSRPVKVPGGEYYGQLNERGQKHGKGKMKYDNGNEYEGEWKNNKRDGKGTTKYASGNVYSGSWKAGKRDGFGVFHIKKTGDIYRGNWAHGLKSGPGVYEYADGELDVSYYQEDIRVGKGVRWSASRHMASRLIDGQLVGEEGAMPVEEAMQLTKNLGFVV